MFEFETLDEILRDLGVCEGDLLYVASDVTLLLREAFKRGIKSTEQRDEYLNEFIDTLQKIVG